MAAMENFGKRDCHSGGHITGILLLPLPLFYYAKSRKDSGLASLTSRGSPNFICQSIGVLFIVLGIYNFA